MPAKQDHVTPEQFLQRLEKLFESTEASHSVFVSHKRINIGAKASSQQNPSSSKTIVVRATDGRGNAEHGRTKFVTHIDATALPSFQDAYSTVLRSNLSNFLRKRDKAKERKVDKLVKEKRKRMEELASSVKLTNVGAKRGAGRRKRQMLKRKLQSFHREKQRVKQAARKVADGGGVGPIAAYGGGSGGGGGVSASATRAS